MYRCPHWRLVKFEFIFVVVLGLGVKTRLTLCPVPEDSGVKEYDTMSLGEWFVFL